MASVSSDKLQKQLEKAVEAFDDAKINSAVERLLAQQNDNLYALRCKLVYLVQQGKFAHFLECQEVAEAMAASLKTDPTVKYMQAYCLYRLQKYDDATKVLDGIAKDGAQAVPLEAPILNLRAQIFYNSEKYAETAKLYEQLLARELYRDDEERSELVTNLSAAYAFVDAAKATQAIREASQPSADLLFNAATAQLEAKNFDKALELLQSAETLLVKSPAGKKSTKTQLAHFDGSDSLAAKSPERVYFDEVSALWTQRAMALQGKNDEAAAARILSVVLQHKPASNATHAIASNNIAAIKRHHDFFETHRRLKHCALPTSVARLTSHQLLVVRYNTAMLLLHTGKLDACRHLVDQIGLEFPSNAFVKMLALALAVRDPKKQKVDELLKEAALQSSADRGAGSLQTQLLMAQIYLEKNDLPSAGKELRQMGDAHGAALRTRLGYVATLTDLLVRSNDAAAAEEVVRSSLAETCSGSAATKAATTEALALFASKYFAQSKLHAASVRVLETAQQLLKKQTSDVLTANLALALSRTDTAKAEAVLKTLPSSAAKGASAPAVSADALEKKVPTRAAIEAAGFKRDAAASNSASTVGQREDSAKRSKQRAMRKPPHAMKRDPTTGALLPMETRPDPERWIPMADRTYIKDLPEKRKKELKRQRAEEQDRRRRANLQKKQAAAAVAAAPAAAPVSA